jgi:hypothetical protein
LDLDVVLTVPPLPDRLSPEEELHYWAWRNPKVDTVEWLKAGWTFSLMEPALYPYRSDLIERQGPLSPAEQADYVELMNHKASLLASGQQLPVPWSESLSEQEELRLWDFTNAEGLFTINATQRGGLSPEEIEARLHPHRRELIERGRPFRYDRWRYRQRMEEKSRTAERSRLLGAPAADSPKLEHTSQVPRPASRGRSLLMSSPEFQRCFQQAMDKVPLAENPTKRRIASALSIHRETLDQYLERGKINWDDARIARRRRLGLIQPTD